MEKHFEGLNKNTSLQGFISLVDEFLRDNNFTPTTVEQEDEIRELYYRTPSAEVPNLFWEVIQGIMDYKSQT